MRKMVEMVDESSVQCKKKKASHAKSSDSIISSSIGGATYGVRGVNNESSALSIPSLFLLVLRGVLLDFFMAIVVLN